MNTGKFIFYLIITIVITIILMESVLKEFRLKDIAKREAKIEILKQKYIEELKQKGYGYKK